MKNINRRSDSAHPTVVGVIQEDLVPLVEIFPSYHLVMPFL